MLPNVLGIGQTGGEEGGLRLLPSIFIPNAGELRGPGAADLQRTFPQCHDAPSRREREREHSRDARPALANLCRIPPKRLE